MNQKMKNKPGYMLVKRINRRASVLLPLLVVLSLVLSACDGGTTASPTATAIIAEPTATTAAVEPTATAAGADATATGPSASTPLPPAGSGIMTVSVQQQATWIRNFNP